MHLSPSQNNQSNERLIRVNSGGSREMEQSSMPGSKDKKREGTSQRREVKTIEYLGTNDESIH